MAFDPSELLALAKSLKDAPESVDEQARYRTGITRAYYAVFLSLLSRVHAELGAENVGTGSIHRRMFEALKKSGAAHLLSIKRELGTMRDARDEAEYELDAQPFSSSHVEDQIVRAEKLLRSIGQVPDRLLRNLKF